MLVLFSLIFVGDTKLIFGYNFVAPLNPHSGYVKLEYYLLQFLLHVTSDAKFLQKLFFLPKLCLSTIKMFKSCKLN